MFVYNPCMDKTKRGRGRPTKEIKADKYIGLRVTARTHEAISAYRRGLEPIPSEAAVIRGWIESALKRDGLLA